MKAFIIRAIIFLSLWSLFLLSNFKINLTFIKSTPLPCAEKESTFLIGDSHIMTDILPDEAQGRFNLGNHGEPYYISYLKVKKLLNTCKAQQRTIILGMGPQNFSNFNDLKLQIPKYAKAIYKDYYPLLLESPSFFKDWKMPYDKRMYYKTIIKTMCLYPHKNHKAWLGHFEGRSYRLAMADLDKTIKRHYYAESDTLCRISKIAMQALDSIITLCGKENVHLIVLTTPLHRQYRKAVPDLFQKQFETMLNTCHEKGIEVFDYSQLNLPDTLFYDYDHLNQKGAAIFTQILKEDLDWK